MKATFFRRILVPYDFSPGATAALRAAVRLAAARGGTLTVLHVMAPVYPATRLGAEAELPVWMPPRELIVETRARLEKAVARLCKGRPPRAVRCRVLVGDRHRGIMRAARAADSIVMGTLGRTGLPHLLVGSTAEKVVRHATVPVLTIRARGGGRRGTRRRGRR
jgi:nucleotide-binding universal stress UspA family protein